jgi:hypothetical protein
MMKRAAWFVAGAASGAVGATYAQRKIKATAARLAPASLAREAGGRLRTRGQHLAEALREGRTAMRAKEDSLRAERAVVVHQPAQVIVLSDIRELEGLDRLDRRISPEHPSARGRRSRR